MRSLFNLELPQDIVEASRLTPQELKVELAITLYAQNRLSLGKASQLAKLSLWEFRQLLATRRVSVHYDQSDFEVDQDTARQVKPK